MLAGIIHQVDPKQTYGTIHRALVDALSEICYYDVTEGRCSCRFEICTLRKQYGYEFACEVRDRLVARHPEVARCE